MPKRVMVLGSRPGSGNIGSAIADRLRDEGCVVSENDCSTLDGYVVPGVNLEPYDVCVITLGATSLTGMRDCLEADIYNVIFGSLMLPMMCIRKYVQDRKTEGKIIVIGSYAHDHSLTNCSAYCAAKAGLDAAVKELGWELTPDFITHIIHPYHVPTTPMGKEVIRGMINDRGMSREEAEAYQKKDLKLWRHLHPEDIADVVHWLLTEPSADWLSGQHLNLYGGVR